MAPVADNTHFIWCPVKDGGGRRWERKIFANWYPCFTVHEPVQRSRTPLRSFYQYFANKEELPLALLEETIADSVAQWRREAGDEDALGGLRVLVHRIHGSTGDDPWNRLNRVLALYHAGLVGTASADPSTAPCR